MNTERDTTQAITPSSFEPLNQVQQPGKTGGWGWRRWLLPVAILLFALVMAFLFTARSVEISVESSTPADIELGGFHLPLGGRYLMLPGVHELHISAPGYVALNTTITVSDAASQRWPFTLQPRPGRVTLLADPEGATATIDGEQAGSTPLTALELAAGTHTLQLRHPRYLPLDDTLQVAGRDRQETFEYRLSPAWAVASVSSEPAGADIFIDGEPVATTPASVEVMQGERQLQLRLPGYAPWQQTLVAKAGAELELGTVTLQPAAGLLELTSTPSGANVTLDGDFQGQTPLTLNLVPGKPQRLMLTRPGYRRHSETVQLAAGATGRKAITLAAQLGEIDLRVSPPEAEVRVNGRLVGRGNQSLSLPTVEHRVEISLPGHRSESRRITPRQGLEQRVAVALQTEQEARVAQVQPEVTSALGQTLRLFIPGEHGPDSFTMGASRREPGRRANEVLRPVTLRRMFYLQTTEVTNAQFRQFLASHNSGQIEGNSLNREHQPVAQVSWQQAAQFCNWLSQREGLPPFYTQSQGIVTGFNPAATGYRLPTEAEWAWVARVKGETRLTFPWGDTFPPTAVLENYADSSSAYVTGRTVNGYNDGQVVSATVASFPANHHGLHDLGGNVAEWVHDVYQIPAANVPAETDPLGPQSGDNYVIRGASWAMSRMSELRLPFRDYGQAGRDDVGFRIARYAE
jgi:formylglycine-generating enzyme required for sulfatase activity